MYKMQLIKMTEGRRIVNENVAEERLEEWNELKWLDEADEENRFLAQITTHVIITRIIFR